MIRTRLSQTTVQQLLHYNQRTGALTWRVDRSRTARAGDDAGFVRADRQIIIRIKGRQYVAQRIIWLYMTGAMPKGRLIFNDGDPTNLKWHNIQLEAEHLSSTKGAARQREYRKRLAAIKEYL